MSRHLVVPDSFGDISRSNPLPVMDGAAMFAAASAAAFTPDATNVEDFFSISAPVGRRVQVVEIGWSGMFTAARTWDFLLRKRGALNTGGTSTTLTGVELDTTGIAPAAVVRTYTAQPTGYGPLLGLVWAGKLILPATPPTVTEAAFPGYAVRYPCWLEENQVLALANPAGTAPAGQSIMCWVKWNEVVLS